MNKYSIASQSSGANIGIYEGATASEAVDAMARDAGYSDFRASCSIYEGIEDLDAEVAKRRADLVVVEVSE